MSLSSLADPLFDAGVYGLHYLVPMSRSTAPTLTPTPAFALALRRIPPDGCTVALRPDQADAVTGRKKLDASVRGLFQPAAQIPYPVTGDSLAFGLSGLLTDQRFRRDVRPGLPP
ncbi:hypothetical protein GCM10010261_11850 [Streptomyces pilosus]|nr:hypothetical protein GCM10010261_11850 [Streptomyces pilosus]